MKVFNLLLLRMKEDSLRHQMNVLSQVSTDLHRDIKAGEQVMSITFEKWTLLAFCRTISMTYLTRINMLLVSHVKIASDKILRKIGIFITNIIGE